MIEDSMALVAGPKAIEKMKDMGLTQKEVGKLLGCDQPTVSRESQTPNVGDAVQVKRPGPKTIERYRRAIKYVMARKSIIGKVDLTTSAEFDPKTDEEWAHHFFRQRIGVVKTEHIDKGDLLTALTVLHAYAVDAVHGSPAFRVRRIIGVLTRFQQVLDHPLATTIGEEELRKILASIGMLMTIAESAATQDDMKGELLINVRGQGAFGQLIGHLLLGDDDERIQDALERLDAVVQRQPDMANGNMANRFLASEHLSLAKHHHYQEYARQLLDFWERHPQKDEITRVYIDLTGRETADGKVNQIPKLCHYWRNKTDQGRIRALVDGAVKRDGLQVPQVLLVAVTLLLNLALAVWAVSHTDRASHSVPIGGTVGLHVASDRRQQSVMAMGDGRIFNCEISSPAVVALGDGRIFELQHHSPRDATA